MMNDTVASKRKVGSGPVGETRNGLKNNQGPTFYILQSDCEVIRESKSLNEIIKYKTKFGFNWSRILEAREVIDYE